MDALLEPLFEIERLLPVRPQRRERRRQPVDLELVDPLRLVDVLEAVLAQIALAHPVRKRRAHERGRRGREQHLPAVARRADARRADDVDPDVALLPDDRLAGMQAHADP